MSDLGFARRVLVACGVLVLVVATCAAVIYTSSILAALFVAIVLAAGLRGAGGWLSERLPVGTTVAMLAILLVLAGSAGGFGFAVAKPLAHQAQQISEQMPQRLEELRTDLRGTPLAQALTSSSTGEPSGLSEENASPRQDRTGSQGFWESGLAGTLFGSGSGGILSAVGRVASGVVAVVGALALVAVCALYLAFRPRPYVVGFLRLLPVRNRDEATQVLGEMAHKLRWWLLGQMSAMLVIGALTGLGLWIIGIPMALALAVLAALMNFIPNFGPVISLVPALLVAQGHYVEVLGLYAGAQLLESYVVTPNIQRAAVHLEPVALIGFQVLMGAMFGVPGLLVAAPLLVVFDVLQRRLWREHALDDPSVEPRHHGPEPA